MKETKNWGLRRFHAESRQFMAGYSRWYFYTRFPRAAWRFFRMQRKATR